MNRGLILRIGAAVAILISGIVHLDLYFNQDYRFASSDVNFGRSILLNAIASGVLATALVARRDWFVKAAGIAFAASTIALFAYTHAENTFLGYSHGGAVFEPSPQAQIALIAQIAAIVLLAASFVPAVEGSRDSAVSPVPLPAVGAAFAISAIALVGLTLKWKPDDTKSVAAPPTTEAPATSVAGSAAPPTSATTSATSPAVTIAGFKFNPPTLTIAKGTTVTWTNTDSTQHSIVADDTSFISENLDQGSTFQFTFDTPGTFSYICGIHPRMMGSITVTG